MYSFVFLGIIACLFSLILTPVIRNLSCKLGWLDTPDNRRKSHPKPIPRIGGVAVFAAYLGAFGLLALGLLNGGQMVRAAVPGWWELIPAAGLVFAIGLLDDLRGVRPSAKLAVQAIAAMIAYSAGVSIETIGGLDVPWWLGFPMTIVWLVGCSNAFNLIDGVDGLAAGAALFATVTIVVGALLEENLALALATAPLAGAILGFLRYNFNPASIFLGDSGSLTVGFLLGSYALIWGQTSATVLGMTAPLMALALPLLDTAVAIVRRFIGGQGIFTADASHIHHRLLSRGLSPRRVALLLYSACGVAATLSLLASVTDGQYKGVVIVLFCGAAWLGIQHLGYVEFGTVGRVISDGAVRRHLAAQINLRNFETAVQHVRTPRECWDALRQAAEKFGYGHVTAMLCGEKYSTDPTSLPATSSAPPSWSVRIPLSGGDYVNLERLSGAGASLSRVGPFADAIQRTLSGRFERPMTPLAEEAEQVEVEVLQRRRSPLKALGAAASRSSLSPRDAGGTA